MGASGRRSEQGGAGGAPGAPRPASPRGRSGRSPSRGRRLSEALISQSRGEGLGDLTLGGTEAFKPVPGPLRPASQPPTSVRPSVCPRGGWAALSRTSGRVRSWGGPPDPVGEGEVGCGRAGKLGSSCRLPAPRPVAQLTVGARQLRPRLPGLW